MQLDWEQSGAARSLDLLLKLSSSSVDSLLAQQNDNKFSLAQELVYDLLYWLMDTRSYF